MMTTTTSAAAAAVTPPPPLPAFQLYQGDATTVLKDSVATESVDMVFWCMYWLVVEIIPPPPVKYLHQRARK